MPTERLPNQYAVSETSNGLTLHSISFNARNGSDAYIGLLPNSLSFNHLESVRDEGEFVPDPDNNLFLNNSQQSFTRSKDFYADKLTLGAHNCLVAAIFATESSTARPISTMYHVSPIFFNYNKPSSKADRADVLSKLKSLKRKVEPGTAGAVIAAGYLGDYGNVYSYRSELAKMLKDSLGVVPVLMPPKNKRGSSSVYIQTADKIVTVVHQYSNF